MYCITYVMGPVNIIAIYATLQSHSLYLGVNHCLIVKLCRHIMTRWLNGEKNNIDSKMECIKSNSVLNLCSVLKCSSLDQWTGWAFEVIHPLFHMYITIYCSHIWFRKKKHEWSSTSFRSLFWASLAFQFYSNRRMERILWFLRESSNKIL